MANPVGMAARIHGGMRGRQLFMAVVGLCWIVAEVGFARSPEKGENNRYALPWGRDAWGGHSRVVLTPAVIKTCIPSNPPPTVFSIWALERYEEFRTGGKPEAKQAFLAGADYLLSTMRIEKATDGSRIGLWAYNMDWDYLNYHYDKPWYSAMAQGMILSLMLRAYDVSDDRRYLDAAELAYHSITKDSAFKIQFVHTDTAGEFWLETFPPFVWPEGRIEPSYVLNGGLVALYGMIEWSDHSGLPAARAYVDRMIRFLENNIARYDIPDIGPSYDLLDRRQVNHFIEFETDADCEEKDLLPVYEIRLYDKTKTLRRMRIAGGQARSDYTNFHSGLVVSGCLSSDKRYEAAGLPISELSLVSNDKIVGTRSLDSKHFAGAWSTPYTKAGRPCRDYQLNGGMNSSGTGGFRVGLQESVPAERELSLRIEYFDAHEHPVAVCLSAPRKFDVGFLRNSGSRTWKAECFHIPRAAESEAYACVRGFHAGKTYDGLLAKTLYLGKRTDKWDGNLLRFKLDPEDAGQIEDNGTVLMDITYKDNATNVVMVNLFTGNNNTIGMLRNRNSRKWKTETVEVPAWLLTRGGSPSSKTTVVNQLLKAMAQTHDMPNTSRMLGKWEASLYTMDHLVGLAYTHGNPEPIQVPLSLVAYPEGCSSNHLAVLFPSITAERWRGPDGNGYRLGLREDDFAYLYLPLSLNQTRYRLEIKYKDTPRTGVLYLGAKTRTRTQLCRIGAIAFRGTGEEKTVVFSYVSD